MNYHGRVMELNLGWSAADLRCMAAEMAAEADQEIARLREALSLALDEIRECDDTDGVRAKVIDVLAAMAEPTK